MGGTFESGIRIPQCQLQVISVDGAVGIADDTRWSTWWLSDRITERSITLRLSGVIGI
jgi:hypothetical protein